MMIDWKEVDWLTERRLIDWLKRGWLIDWKEVDWLTEKRLIDWLKRGWLIDWKEVDWLTERRLIDWLKRGWLIDWKEVDWLTEKRLIDWKEVDWLTEKRLIDWLKGGWLIDMRQNRFPPITIDKKQLNLTFWALLFYLKGPVRRAFFSRWQPGRFCHVTRAVWPLINRCSFVAAKPPVWHGKSGLAASVQDLPLLRVQLALPTAAVTPPKKRSSDIA